MSALWELSETLARLMDRDVVTGVPAAVLTKKSFHVPKLAIYPNDYFNDWNGRFRVGEHRDTTFVVTDFEKTNGKVVFSPELTTAVVAADLFYMIGPEYTPEELITVINLALSQVEAEALQAKDDTGLAVKASTYEYLVPAGFSWIQHIYQETSTGDRYSASGNLIDEKHWRILPGPAPKIWFNNDYAVLTTGRKLRLVGQGPPAQLVLDADVTQVNTMYVVYQAKALLHQARIRGQGADFEEHRTQLVLAQGLADRERKRLLVAGRGKKVVP